MTEPGWELFLHEEGLADGGQCPAQLRAQIVAVEVAGASLGLGLGDSHQEGGKEAPPWGLGAGSGWGALPVPEKFTQVTHPL